MICNDADRDIIVVLFPVFFFRKAAYVITKRFNRINIKNRIYILHNRRQTFQSHSRINILLLQLTVIAEAIEKCINEYYPDVQVNIEHAEGLKECKKILTLAKAGKMNGCLIEGMGCPGGCIAGAGTNIPLPKAKKDLAAFVKNSSKSIPPKELEEIELD